MGNKKKSMMKKRIFTFWEPKTKLPAYVKLCMQTWKKFLPDYEIVVLDYDTLSNWFDKKTIQSFLYKKTSLAKQADCIRAALLYKYGGIWLDADTIITKSNFITQTNKSEVLMIGTETGAHGAFIYASKPRTKFISEWYEQVKKRVKIYRFVNSCKLVRKLYHKTYEICNNWDYFLNSIIDPIIRKYKKENLLVLHRDKINAFPEHASKLNTGYITKDVLYQDFYFFNKDQISVHKIIEDNQGIILLHNSWTPKEYKKMTEDQFLNSDSNLANILKVLLK